MTRIWFKKTPLCLALTLFALPAMADNVFSGVINFGREILDETRKLAPGVQNDRRNETPADTSAALQDGRDRPAIEAPSNDQYNQYQNDNYQSGGNQLNNSRSNIELAPPVNGQPTGSNLNYTYGDGQRSTTSRNANQNQPFQDNQNTQYQNAQGGQYQDNQAEQNQQSSGSNQGWQEENHLQ